jgi:hypothetical protein
MANHRAKRKSGAIDRYLKSPANQVGLSLRNTEKIKTKNPMDEFNELQKPFVPVAAEPKPLQEETTVELPSALETLQQIEPGEDEFDFESSMPLYCNYCNLNTKCPHGKKSIARKDQKELVVCAKRLEFKQLVADSGTNDRNGLIKYIHKLRNINAARIGRLIYSESLSGEGQDRNLSLLIDKQIDSAMAEYKLLIPQEKNTNTFNFQLTQVHKTVDTINILPTEIKTYLLQALRNKLAQVKDPKQYAKELLSSIPSNLNPSIVSDQSTDIPKSAVQSDLNNVGGAGGKVTGAPGTADDPATEEL